MGVGTALTALVGVAVWQEALDLLKLSCISLVITRVVFLNLSTPSQTEPHSSS